MGNQFDASVALSHHLQRDGALSGETRERLEMGISHLETGFSRVLILTGGYADMGVNISHASAMRKEAIERGTDREKIYIEDRSLDTVGQAVLTKRDVVDPNNFRSLTVISHDYHIQRVGLIFDFVFGEGYELGYCAVASDDISSKRKGEQASVEIFQETFRGVSPGCDEEIFGRLVERHPLYLHLRSSEKHVEASDICRR
jgi:uncharacterized SAM-binding protein YcdF (DUF218 family)